MNNPWPRRVASISTLVFLSILGAVAFSVPWPEEDMRDLHDSVGEHGAALSAGHATLGEGSCVYCHFSHPAKAQRPLWQTQGDMDAAMFARESMQAGGVKTGLCLSCHDGTVASVLRAHSSSPSSSRPRSQSVDLGANHPVGVDYMSVVNSRPDVYNPASSPGIILEDGKVGCVSCHSTHDLGALSADNARADVCTACHRY